MLVVVEGDDGALAAARGQAVAAGLEVRESWEPGSTPSRVACTGVVADLDQAAAAVFAAVKGASVIIDARASREVVDRLCDDLRRIGPTEHRLPRSDQPVVLPAEHRELLLLIAEGRSLAEASRRLHISRRTVDRRLATARRVLGVATTTEAVRAVVREPT